MSASRASHKTGGPAPADDQSVDGPDGAQRPGDGRVRCAGCRQEMSRDDAERVVWHERIGFVFDMRGGAPGEEAFVHPHPECVGAACWGGFARMLGREVERPDRDAFMREMRDGLRSRLLERLGDAGRAGSAGASTSKVDEMVSSHRAELVLVAEDASNEAETIAQRAERSDVPVLEVLDAESLGKPVGRDAIDIWAVSDEEFAEACGLDAEKIISMQSPLQDG